MLGMIKTWNSSISSQVLTFDGVVFEIYYERQIAVILKRLSSKPFICNEAWPAELGDC